MNYYILMDITNYNTYHLMPYLKLQENCLETLEINMLLELNQLKCQIRVVVYGGNLIHLFCM